MFDRESALRRSLRVSRLVACAFILGAGLLCPSCLVEDGGGSDDAGTVSDADTSQEDAQTDGGDAIADVSQDSDTPEDAMDGGVDVDDTTVDDGGVDDGGTTPQRQVQDYWIYETILTIDDSGNTVDLTEAIVDNFSGAPDRTVTLTTDVEFQVYDALDPYLVDVNGTTRDDVEVVGGIVESPTGRALGVVATPEPGGGPITEIDYVRFDLTFLGDQLAPGDALLVDMAFMQGIPSENPADESGLTGLELLAERMEQGRVQFWGEERDGEVFVKVFRQEIGIAVDGSTEGEVPAKAQPMMDGLQDGAKECGKGLLTGDSTLDCVSAHWENFGDGAKESADQIYGCNLDPGGCGDPEPSPPPRCINGCGSSSNDPHIVTLDGKGYDLQLVGEFVAAQSDSMDVQIRTAPWGSSSTVSTTVAVAVEVDGHQVNILRRDDAPTEPIVVDGSAVPLDDLRGDGMDLGAGHISYRGRTARITSADGDVLYVDMKRSRLDIFLAPASSGGDWSGLWGDNDDDPSNDLKLRDGTAVDEPTSSSMQDFYDTFGADWRISSAESLFDYDSGEDTSTYTDTSFPSEIVTVDTLPADERSRAEAICRGVGIVDEFALNSCILDFAVTGDIDFVRSARLIDIVEGIRAGARLPDGTPTSRNCNTYEECISRACNLEAHDVEAQHEPGPDEALTHTCPAGCEDRSGRSVWGTDIYTDDSSICRAAVHDGIIGAEGGQVTFWMEEGLDSYEATDRNGVSSQSWGSWGGSFVFQQEWSCDDEVDNDGDGDTDCDDDECSEECQ